MKEIKFESKVPVVGSYDVVVIGGGPSGWVAAIAARRNGKSVALIERYGFFGGTATAGYVVPISGYFKNEKRVVGGIPWEFVERLMKRNAALPEMPKGHISVDPEAYKLVSQQMLTEAGVDLYTNHYLSDVVMDGKKVCAVRTESKSGSEVIEGKIFIDATGDGDLCFKAGMPMLPRDENTQPLSMCFVLSGVDLTTDLLKNSIHHTGAKGTHSIHREIAAYLDELHDRGEGPQFGGPWFNTLLVGDLVAVNITRAEAFADDAHSLTLAETRMREDMFEIVELLRKKYPEFKNAVIASSAINGGVREGRHIDGEYLVTADDLLTCKTFDDSIARNAHPIDIHVPGCTAQTLIPVNESGYIPYRTMIVRGFDNLIASGRMIAADRGAHATIRVQATVMAIGQAAGAAAALAIDTARPVTDIAIDELHKRLDTLGGIY